MSRIAIIGHGATGRVLADRIRAVAEVALVGRGGYFPRDEKAIFVTVRATDLDPVLKDLASSRVQVPIVFCQNGLAVAARAAGRLAGTGAPLVRASLWFGARREPPSLVGEGPIELAPIESQAHGAAHAVAELLGSAGFDARVLADASRLEWRKALVNAVINPVCAWARVPNGAILVNPELRSWGEQIADEAIAVARAEGVSLDSGDRDRVWATASATAANRNSMLADLDAGRETEIENLNGEIARLGGERGIPTPANDRALAWIRGKIFLPG